MLVFVQILSYHGVYLRAYANLSQHPQPWIPSEPSLQNGDKGGNERIGCDLGGIKTIPVRAVEAGEFVLESWIEEGKAKASYDT